MLSYDNQGVLLLHGGFGGVAGFVLGPIALFVRLLIGWSLGGLVGDHLLA